MDLTLLRCYSRAGGPLSGAKPCAKSRAWRKGGRTSQLYVPQPLRGTDMTSRWVFLHMTRCDGVEGMGQIWGLGLSRYSMKNIERIDMLRGMKNKMDQIDK